MVLLGDKAQLEAHFGVFGDSARNTPGVWIPHLHLHFINMSIIHPFMSLDCMKHVFETLQHIVTFHVCLF